MVWGAQGEGLDLTQDIKEDFLKEVIAAGRRQGGGASCMHRRQGASSRQRNSMDTSLRGACLPRERGCHLPDLSSVVQRLGVCALELGGWA